jgi:DNA polymerase III delta prime subunit
MKDLLLNRSTELSLKRWLGNPSHGLLLSGSKASGKGYVAKHIAYEILSKKSQLSGLKQLDGDSGIGISEVRELQNFLSLIVPGGSKIRRVIIIEHIDKLGHEAQNVLLKILEEPPKDTVFICTTDSENQILLTIQSRLSKIIIYPVQKRQIDEKFSRIYPAWEIDKAYMLSDGKVAEVEQLLEQGSDHSLNKAVDWAKMILRSNVFERLSSIDGVSKDTDKLPDYLFALQRVLRASLMLSKDLTTEQMSRRTLQLEAVISARKSLRLNVQPKIVLSNLFVSL